MILKFEKVIAHNFACYQDAELTLSNMGYTIVSGKNNSTSDNALSNGSGKSSIFNAICYAMTGETAQGLSNNIENIYTDPNDCWVELQFWADEDEFILRRYKTPKPDLKIYINGEDRSGKGIRESQRILEGYLPDINSQLLGSIIILGQGLPYRFTYNTPGARKFLLEKLTKSDYMVQSVKDKLDNRKEELKQQLRALEDKDVANKTKMKLYVDRLNKLTKELNEYTEESSEGTLEDQLNDIHDSINFYNMQLIDLDDNKTIIENNINGLTQNKLDLTKEDSNNLELKLKPVNEIIHNLNIKLAEYSVEKKSLEKEIKRLDAVTDICPTCGQKIQGVHKIDTTELKTKLSNLNEVISSCNFNLDENIKQKDTATQEHYTITTNKYKDLDNQLIAYKKELDNTNKKINSINALMQSAMKEEIRLQSFQKNFLNVQNDLLETTTIVEKLKEEKNNLDNGIRDVNEHLNVIQNLITLAKREFRSVLLDNVIKYMDMKAKQYSKEVFGAELITIATDENYINVIFNNKYYEALSGGEKQKVDIIIQLALRDLLSNQLNLHANLFVLDEALDFLDEKGADSILRLIQTSMGDISSIFMISHHAVELNISYDNLIEVTKGDDGVSTISIK